MPTVNYKTFLDFSHAATRMTESMDKPESGYDVAKDTPAQGGYRAGDGFKRLSELEQAGLFVFTPGPVYCLLGVDWDLLRDFAEVAATDVDVTTLEFPQEVFCGLGRWGCLLQAIPAELAPAFQAYMTTAVFRREGGLYSRVLSGTYRITDPCAAARREIVAAGVGQEADVCVFYPATSRASIRIRVRKVDGIERLTFAVEPPDPVIVLEAEAGQKGSLVAAAEPGAAQRVMTALQNHSKKGQHR